MKISYSNYPILEKLHKGSLGNMPLFHTDKKFFDIYGSAFVNNWKFNCKYFQNEINVISIPFYEATVKAEKSLVDLWEDIVLCWMSMIVCKTDIPAHYLMEMLQNSCVFLQVLKAQ